MICLYDHETNPIEKFSTYVCTYIRMCVRTYIHYEIAVSRQLQCETVREEGGVVR